MDLIRRLVEMKEFRRRIHLEVVYLVLLQEKKAKAKLKYENCCHTNEVDFFFDSLNRFKVDIEYRIIENLIGMKSEIIIDEERRKRKKQQHTYRFQFLFEFRLFANAILDEDLFHLDRY